MLGEPDANHRCLGRERPVDPYGCGARAFRVHRSGVSSRASAIADVGGLDGGDEPSWQRFAAGRLPAALLPSVPKRHAGLCRSRDTADPATAALTAPRTITQRPEDAVAATATSTAPHSRRRHPVGSVMRSLLRDVSLTLAVAAACSVLAGGVRAVAGRNRPLHGVCAGNASSARVRRVARAASAPTAGAAAGASAGVWRRRVLWRHRRRPWSSTPRLPTPMSAA